MAQIDPTKPQAMQFQGGGSPVNAQKNNTSAQEATNSKNNSVFSQKTTNDQDNKSINSAPNTSKKSNIDKAEKNKEDLEILQEIIQNANENESTQKDEKQDSDSATNWKKNFKNLFKKQEGAGRTGTNQGNISPGNKTLD